MKLKTGMPIVALFEDGKMMSRKIVVLTLMFLLSSSLLAVRGFAATPTPAELINMAGSQRMISQRMFRNYCLAGVGSRYKDPAKDLDALVARFDEQLALLIKTAPSDAVLQEFSRVDELWQQVRPVLTASPDKEQAVALWEQTNRLLALSHQAVLGLVKAYGGGASEIVNLAGRQRMLSQRMAALYVFNLWQGNLDTFFAEFQKVVEEFRTANNRLLQSGETTPAIRQELIKAGKYFRWFEQAAARKSKHLTPEIVQRNSDMLLEAMDRITGMYAEK
jgi:nitrate/nitrite-specific signal transduction histidine kinase